MTQSIIHVALVVREYDEAIAFFCGTLGFTLIEDRDVPEQDKRWVLSPLLDRRHQAPAGTCGHAGPGQPALAIRPAAASSCS